jgi:prophage antirepressor-like protein
MKNDITIFNNPSFGSIRTMHQDGIPYFCLSDVCKALDIKNSRNVKNRIDEAGVHSMDTWVNTGNQGDEVRKKRIQKLNYLDEAGLYEVIFLSRKESVTEFKRWVTREVLPSIRKYGMYAKEELLNNPDLLIEMATALKNSNAQIESMKGNLIDFNKFMASDGTFSIEDVGKINGIGRNTLFELLRKKMVLMPSNAPYQKYMNRKPSLFKCIIATHQQHGKDVITPVTRVYPEGLTFISNIIKEDNKNGKQDGRSTTNLHAQ